MTQRPPGPPTPPHQQRFTRIRFREGYDMEDVDDFLRRAHHALRTRDGSMTVSDVHGARFRPVRVREGYAMGEVDEELDRIAVALQESQRSEGTPGT